ncbi:MAG: zf-HC2 domain-containing protein [Planctomycetota bacterium]
MDCSEVKELLSAYYDDELSSDKRTAVANHLAGCDDCVHELEIFRNLSALADGLTHPEPPAHIWQQIEKELGSEQQNRSERPRIFEWLGWTKQPAVRFGLAIAAAILIAIGWFGYTTWFEHDPDHQLAAVFGEYLDEFRRDPVAAQKILLANYEGQAVTVEQAVRTVGYRPAVADGLPDGYTVGETYVMKMPCCTCVQCLCQSSDGTTIAIFEHDDKEADWFGDRPQTEAICDGTRCSLVELDDRIAATWQRGKRHMTLVGVKDKAEVERLVAWFDDRRRTRSRE